MILVYHRHAKEEACSVNRDKLQLGLHRVLNQDLRLTARLLALLEQSTLRHLVALAEELAQAIDPNKLIEAEPLLLIEKERARLNVEELRQEVPVLLRLALHLRCREVHHANAWHGQGGDVPALPHVGEVLGEPTFAAGRRP